MSPKPAMSDPNRQPAMTEKKFDSSVSELRISVQRLAKRQRAERERMDRFGRFGGR